MDARSIEPAAAATAVASEPLRPRRGQDPRTRLLLEARILPTILRLGVPNMAVMLLQSCVGLIETFWVGRLGTDALAGVALVFPALMLMQMMSAGAVGGGISAAVARTLGAGRRDDADALALHALVIAVAFGLAFTAALIGGGRLLYGSMGGQGGSLAAALIYSNVVAGGAVLIWIFNSLAGVVRGTGNILMPAWVSCIGALLLIPLSPCLIFGIGPLPRLGVAGGGVAVLFYYAGGSAVFWAYLASGRSVVRLSLAASVLRWTLFYEILRIGAVAALITVTTNVTIAVITALVGSFGPAAIAGYGVGSRLEYLLVPLVFGLAGPLVAMVGTSVGADNRQRALRVAWIGAAIATVLCEAIGVAAAAFPRAWLTLFSSDPMMLDAGTRYLHVVGPFYGLFGLGMALYFASQGAGTLRWPLTAGLLRLVVASGGGWLALRLSGDLTLVFAALALALVVFGLTNAIAVARGAWFGGGLHR